MSGVKSTDDQRVANSGVRHKYRRVTETEKAQIDAIKDKGQEFLDLIEECGSGRELSIARTKAEEAVMWAVKHVTR